MKRRRRRRNCGFVDDCYVLSRKKIVREGNFMEEMAPAVALPWGVGNSVCENPMEITRLKLMADTAASILMPDPVADDLVGRDNSSQCEGEDDVEVRMMPGGDDDAAPVALHSETGTPSSAVDCAMGISSGSVELIGGSVLDVSLEIADPELRGRKRSVFLLDYFPLWGCVSIRGRSPEMEDAVVAVPWFFEIPLRMVAGDGPVDGLDASSVRLPAHFFGVYDGHGGAQVANYCRERVHQVLIEELQSVGECSGDGWKKQWEKAFTDCFQKVDDDVGGIAMGGSMGEEESNDCCVSPVEPIAPETVGSTAVVAVICSSHIIIANCGDSRAVLCRGKLPVALSVDHKPDREDEYARIEAAGGKVIQWNGYRVLGVLAMSRSIGDRYLKPWIIPEPEVMVVPRTKDDECLILASDGLWDAMSNEEACDAARRRIALWHKKNGVVSASTQKGEEEADPAAQAAAEYLSKLALQKGSKDNISVIVVDLKAQRRFRSKS